MVLYDYFRSSAAFRVRIALNWKGLQAERRFIHLRKGEQRAPGYLALNPQGFVPMLVVGDRRITQSLAILEYLEERHPLPPLLPEGAEDRALARAVAMAIACDIHPLDNLRVLKYLQRELGLDQAARDAWFGHWIAEGFRAVEALIAGRPGPFCLGGAPTFADVCLVPQVANARRVNLDLAPFPRIAAVEAHCLTVPAFADARPDRQPDAE